MTEPRLSDYLGSHSTSRIAHGYFDINLETVWSTVTAALPELLASLKCANSIDGGLDT